MLIEYKTGARREVPDDIGRELIARGIARPAQSATDASQPRIRKPRAYKRRDLLSETP